MTAVGQRRGGHQLHGCFRQRAYTHDIVWLSPDGGEMTREEWHLPFARCVGARFPSASASEPDLLMHANETWDLRHSATRTIRIER